MTERIYINDGWEFTEAFDGAFAAGAETKMFQTVRLPHTVKETPYSYFDESIYQMQAGYRRTIRPREEWKGKRVFLVIEAAGHGAGVYADGKLLREHFCGYTAFETELTDCLQQGKDLLLAVKTDTRETQNIPPFGYVIDYMTYGGLYREAYLEVREQTYIKDVFVQAEPELSDHSGIVKAEITVADPPKRTGSDPKEQILWARVKIRKKGRTAVCAEQEFLLPEPRQGAEKETAGPAADRIVNVILKAEEIGLWDLNEPQLYVLETELYKGETLLDRIETVFGFRKAEFRADGFYLNGRKVKLTGLNRHQSFPYAGYAMPRSMQIRDADILKKELGVNAVRTSHYPQAQSFYDRCDETGLLVFTEIPGWQHLGDEEWKRQAMQNTREMVLQYRNHPSVILWGVRVNESPDDDVLYAATNRIAHELDPSRATGGVRYMKKSSLLEDVYTYNDFSHNGTNAGVEKKAKVTSDMQKAYLVSEYNGHMYPTKAFDSEDHRLSHALRHAKVLDAIAGEEDIAGGFGWCMFDYNTHQDFGSGDRICYHGVLDMFRNPKTAAYVYAAQQDEEPVLEITSAMDIGEHPTGNPGRVYIITNADSVRMYKSDRFIREYTHADSEYGHMKNGPILISDFIGDQMIEGEGYTEAQSEDVKYILNRSAIYGFSKLPAKVLAKGLKLIMRYHMKYEDAYRLYGKYIGNWGDSTKDWKFEAIKDGKVVKTVIKAPVRSVHLAAEADHTELVEGTSWDAAAVRLTMRDQNGNILPFFQGAVHIRCEGPVGIIGPETAVLRGGMGGTFVKTTGEEGEASLLFETEQGSPVRIGFTVRKDNGCRHL